MYTGRSSSATEFIEIFQSEKRYYTASNILVILSVRGLISAKAGEKVLIPINMRDGCILAVGKGNEAWNCSAPHGAGRLMSRNQAKSTLSLDEYKDQLRGIYSSSVVSSTLDEAPMAYKPLDQSFPKLKIPSK